MRTARVPLGIEADEVRRLTLAGRSRADVAARFGVTSQQLAKWCQNHHVPCPSRTPGPHGGPPRTPADIADRARELRRALDDDPSGGRPPLVPAPAAPAPEPDPQEVPAVSAEPAPPAPDAQRPGMVVFTYDPSADAPAAPAHLAPIAFAPLRLAAEALRKEIASRAAALEVAKAHLTEAHADLAAVERAAAVLARSQQGESA